MKRISIVSMIVAASLSQSVTAHDPSQHATHEGAGPECSKMKDMDMSKMDANDPVMKAMLAKCKEHMPHDGADHGDEHEHAKTNADQHAHDQHANEDND